MTAETQKLRKEIDSKQQLYEQRRIAELQQEIAEITGRPSVSTKLSFLERRAADLRERKKAGKSVSSANALVTFSCRDDAREGLEEFVTSHPGVAKNQSAFIRVALAEYFANHNQKRMAKLFVDAD